MRSISQRFAPSLSASFNLPPAATAHRTLRRLPRHWLLWAVWVALAAALSLASAQVLAQARPAASASAVSTGTVNGNGSKAGAEADALPSVEELRRQLDAVPKVLVDSDDGRKLLTEVNGVGTAAEQLAAQRTEALADIDSRLAGLGPAPEKGAAPDAPDVAQQRASLGRQRAVIDAEVKLARLVSVDAEQRGTELIRQRREQFRAALTARTDPPLGPAFWRNLRNALPGDSARLQTLAASVRRAVGLAMQPGQRDTFLGSLLGALALVVVGTWLAPRALVRMVPTRLPAGRLRRSLLAAAAVTAYVLLTGMAVELAWSGLAGGRPLVDDLKVLSDATLRMAVFAAFVAGLGQALLSRKRSSWRLPAIDDDLARRLGPYPWWVAIVASVSALATEINGLIGASLALEVSVHAATAMAVAAIVALVLRQLRVSRPAPEPVARSSAAADAPAGALVRPVWLSVLIACAGVAAAAAVVAVALGYIALAGTITRQMLWTGVVLTTAYLLLVLVDDVCNALVSSKGIFGERLHQGLGMDAKVLDQAAVLASGALRLALFFYLLIALMAPFGTGPDEVFRRGSTLDNSLKVGDLALAPQSLVTALAVVLAGLLLIRVLKHWLTEHYFPTTALEPGMRSSIVTLLGYAGGVVVVAVALAGLGISVERIAWVASALSVGIGFGLQAIVQNFISGLILLAERPVKVGDWVVLGDTEGDVRRVNVRATEIQLGDKSTVIVPNSEFITKTVRNMTQTGAQGRVLLRLPAPLDTDAEHMRDVILGVFHAHEGVLGDPAPVVQIEGVTGGTLTFVAIGYVSNPRNAGGVRSDLMFGILAALRGAGLTLSPPATTSVARAVPGSAVASPSPEPPPLGDSA